MKIIIKLFILIFLPLSFYCQSNKANEEFLVKINLGFPIETILGELRDNNLKLIEKVSDELNIWLCENIITSNYSLNINIPFSNSKIIQEIQTNHKIEHRPGYNLVPSTISLSKMNGISNDSLFNNQWALNNTGQTGGTTDSDIDAIKAWDINSGGKTILNEEIVIAIIDNGFDLTHKDINFWKNNSEIPNNGIDDDSNGYIDDYDGWNAYQNNGEIPLGYHGTHVAGIAGAFGNNGLGISGINQNVKILPIAGSSGDEAIIIKAYEYALSMKKLYEESNGNKGANILVTNASFGVDKGNPLDFPLLCEMYDTLGQNGIISVAATANANWDVDIVGDIPTACPSDYLISVTNTDHNDNKNSSSAFGKINIDLGAPGTSIISTYPINNYAYLTGTSMASPTVAGAVSLLFASASKKFMDEYKLNPSSGLIKLKNILLSSVDYNSSLNNITSSNGRLNLFNAVKTINNYNSNIIVSKPELFSPSNNSEDFDRNGTFLWKNVNGANYNLQIFKDSLKIIPDFEVNIYADSTFKLVDSLEYFSNYKWRIRSFYLTDTSSWSNLWDFKTVDNYTPTLLFPLNNSKEISNLSVNFSWELKDLIDNSSSINSTFRLIIGNEHTLSVDTSVIRSINNSNYNINLDAEKKYFWSIFTIKDEKIVAVSDTFSFSTVGYISELSTNAEYNNGWNLISVPFKSTSMETKDLFSNSNSKAFYFNNNYFSIDTLKLGEGYWLKFPFKDTVQLRGSIVNTTTSVRIGWNIIGITEKEIDVNSITSSPSNIIDSEFYNFTDRYNSVDTLKLGYGYWVKVINDGELFFNSSTRSKKIIPQNKINKSWGKIIVSDKSNFTKTLYVANSFYGNFELPPKPPSAIKDIRFSNNNYVIAISDSRKILEFQNLDYPITIEVKNFELNIRDLLNGSVVSQHITNGQKILIENNFINKLIIEENIVPKEYTLSQNYPNPFNPSTIISFSLPENTKAKLEVYNLLGEKISTILNKDLPAGFHEIEFNSNNLPSGIYIYRLQTNNFSKAKKMIIIK